MINPTERKAIHKWGNSLLRPLVPYNLLEKSTIKSTHDDGAKLVYVKFFFGIKTGSVGSIPFDGTFGNRITNLSEESLWSYTNSGQFIPEGFIKKEFETIKIRTGTVRKCSRCKGQGVVTCSTCKGKIRWHEKKMNGDVVEKICSCGNGKENCSLCAGYGETEDAIIVHTSFNLNESKKSQYAGEVPESNIKKISGGLIYENQFEYPLERVKELLIGGLNMEEMTELNEYQHGAIKRDLDSKLTGTDVDIHPIYTELLALFETINQLGESSKVLEHEFVPIRVLVRVENAPVKRIDYKFKNKDYSIWIYGKENQIWYQKTPKSLNVKGVMLIAFVVISAGFILFASL